MSRSRSAAGFTLLELVVVLSLVAVVMALSFSAWRGHIAQRQLQYGIVQVATDLREGQERAKEARVQYTVTFTAASSAYVIAGGTFAENARLPDDVTVTANDIVTFSAFGQPDAAHTITIQNSTGNGTVTVNATGGINYQTP